MRVGTIYFLNKTNMLPHKALQVPRITKMLLSGPKHCINDEWAEHKSWNNYYLSGLTCVILSTGVGIPSITSGGSSCKAGLSGCAGGAC